MRYASPIFQQYRKVIARQLATHSSSLGPSIVGAFVEAALDAMVEYLRATRGPEAAYELLSRCADQALSPVLVADPSPLKRETQ